MTVTPAFAPLESYRLSWYRTPQRLSHFAELTTLDALPDYQRWARRHDRPLYYLGNGSNTLFGRTRVETAVLRNSLPRSITALGGDEYEVSSSTPVMHVLRYCLGANLDSFYYLASVPATIGGALAMNAGRGPRHRQTVFDFVRRLTYMRGGEIETVAADSLPVGYRSTPFTGIQDRFLVSAVFAFPEAGDVAGNPIAERILWAVQHQDNRHPSCGSVFAHYNSAVMRLLMGRSVRGALWSPKTANWLQNAGGCSAEDLVRMIRLAEFSHRIVLSRAALELVVVP